MFDWFKNFSLSVSKPIEILGDLLGFPDTPGYETKAAAAPNRNLLGGFLGFPATPNYADASVATLPAPSGDDSDDDDNDDNDDNE